MNECRRIFMSRLWLGALALLMLCAGGVYAFGQFSGMSISLQDYNARNNQWTQTLSETTPEQGLLVLEQWQNERVSWAVAEFLLRDEAEGRLTEDILDSYKEHYPDIEAHMEALRQGQTPEDDWAQSLVVERWTARLEYRLGYEERIDNIAAQAQRIRSNPLFSKPGSFDYRNAEKTETDFNAIAGVVFSTHPNDAVDSLLADRANLLFSLCLVAVTVVLLLEPKRLGVELVERSCANGRTVLTFQRILALLLTAFVAAVAMIGAVLVTGLALYDQTIPFNDPVQTLEYFQNWTADTTIGGFLVWMVLFRTGGLWLTGLLLWLALSRFKSLPVGLVLCGGVLLVEYRWFSSYGINDALYPLASFNLFHLLSAEGVAVRYLNYDVFGFPVNERVLLPVLMGGLIAISGGALLLTSHFSRGTRQSGKLARLLERLAVALRRRRRPRPLLRYEGRKGLIYSGGLVILAAGGVFLSGLNTPYLWLEQEEALLADYTRMYAGELSEDTLTEIRAKRDEAWKNYNCLISLPSEETGSVDLGSFRNRCGALDRLVEQYEGLMALNDPNVELVDYTPFERIYGDTGKTLRLQEAACVLLMLCFAIPGLFALDDRQKMRLSLLSAADGRTKLWGAKAVLAFSFAGFGWLFWTLRELLLLHEAGIRWKALTAGGLNLAHWSESMGTLPLWVPVVGLYLLRLGGLFSACGVLLLISARLGALLPCAGLGMTILVLPQGLVLMGANWLTMFSWCDRLAGALKPNWLWLVFWLVLGSVCAFMSQLQWRRYRS